MTQDARAFCGVCNSPILDRPKTCAICKSPFCHKHEYLLTLVRDKGTDVFYACNSCIEKNHYHVLDPNHPLYLNTKENR